MRAHLRPTLSVEGKQRGGRESVEGPPNASVAPAAGPLKCPAGSSSRSRDTVHSAAQHSGRQNCCTQLHASPPSWSEELEAGQAPRPGSPPPPLDARCRMLSKGGQGSVERSHVMTMYVDTTAAMPHAHVMTRSKKSPRAPWRVMTLGLEATLPPRRRWRPSMGQIK